MAWLIFEDKHMWWLAFPVGYIAKKAYDVLTESKTTPVDYRKALAAQKGMRTKARKKAVTEMLQQRREQAYEKIKASALELGVGEVEVVTRYSGRQSLSFPDLDGSLRSLKSTLKVLEPDSQQKPVRKPILGLQPLEEAVEDIVEIANSEYGSTAGLNTADTYEEAKDPFLERLRTKEHAPN